MVYKAIGITSAEMPGGLRIVYVHFHEKGGQWNVDILHLASYEYPPEWLDRLDRAASLPAPEYQLLHVEFGQFLGQQVNHFMNENNLAHRVDLISSFGFEAFHFPDKQLTGQLGAGSSIAAETGLPVVSDLLAMDLALGGHGDLSLSAGDKMVVAGEIAGLYKEALLVALLGVLRWREEYTALSAHTGARRNSIGGALWMGGEA